MNSFSLPKDKYPGHTFHVPEYSDYKCFIGGDYGLAIHPLKGKEPNWFWRKMHYLVLGFEWKKVK